MLDNLLSFVRVQLFFIFNTFTTHFYFDIESGFGRICTVFGFFTIIRFFSFFFQRGSEHALHAPCKLVMLDMPFSTNPGLYTVLCLLFNKFLFIPGVVFSRHLS